MSVPGPANTRDLRLGTGGVLAAAVGVLLPFLLFSSPEYRETGLLAFGAVSTILGSRLPAVRETLRGGAVRFALGCVFVVQAAAFAGGIGQGQSAGAALLMAAEGLVAILGIGVFCVVASAPRWSGRMVAVALGLAAVLVVSSLAGYFVFYDWHVAQARETIHSDARRLALVWPTRMLTAGMGQEFWDHTNTAAYYFAIAWAVLVGRLARPARFAAAGWVLAGLLAVAVFLTGSRAAWVMIAASLPFLLAFRGWNHALRTFALLGISVGIGFLGLKYKLAAIAPPPSAAQAPSKWNEPGAIHVGGLVDRGSAGRLDGYQRLWKEIEGSRNCGLGHPMARKPVGVLLHEHSTYLATLRCGGIVALSAHLALLGTSLWGALTLARRGRRGPLVLAVVVFSGLLFDRSTVFLLTGFDEFPTHWLAVWLPLAMRPGRDAADGVRDASARG